MAELYGYWLDLAPPRPRRDVDPLAIGEPLLAHVSLGHYLNDCNDLRYDLVSRELKKVAPRLVPGSRTSDALRLERSDFDLIHNLLCAVGRAGVPRVYAISYRSLELMPRKVYTILLPLGLDDEGRNAEDLLFGVWNQQNPEYSSIDSFVDLTSDFQKGLKGKG